MPASSVTLVGVLFLGLACACVAAAAAAAAAVRVQAVHAHTATRAMLRRAPRSRVLLATTTNMPGVPASRRALDDDAVRSPRRSPLSPPPSPSPSPSPASPAPAGDLNAYVMRDGPPSFFSPLDDDGPACAAGARARARQAALSGSSARARPVLVYVPGIEFSGFTISKQLERLAADYEVRIFRVAPGDRTPADELHRVVLAELERVSAQGRRAVLLGESFGGVIALDAALRVGKAGGAHSLAALVLINPATAIGRTPWPSLAAALEALPDRLYESLPSLVTPVLTPVLAPARSTAARSHGGGGAHAHARAERGANADAPAGEGEEGGGGGGEERRSAVDRLGSRLSERLAQPISVARRLSELLPTLEQLPRALPRATLAFRLRELDRYAALLNARDWTEARVPTLVLASTEDLVVPSTHAADAIRRRLRGARVRLLRGASHTPLLEPGIDLGAILRQEGVLALPTPARRDYVAEFTGPSDAAFRAAERALRPLRRLVSPVFFSTGADGARLPGLAAVPRPRRPDGSARPLLFVGNHQLFGTTDLPLLVEELHRSRGVLARGLAHPVAFRTGREEHAARDAELDAELAAELAGVDVGAEAGAALAHEAEVRAQPGGEADVGAMGAAGQLGRADADDPFAAAPDAPTGGSLDPTVMSSWAAFGAVPSSARSLYRLLQRGEAALLFPGGVREAFKRKGERYRLFWPSPATSADFMRTAARFNATVVPVACVGAEDGYEVVLDSDELLSLPAGIGARVRESAAQVPEVAGRPGEPWVSPIALPRLPPPRYYYCFGAPFDTTELDPADAEASARAYGRVKAELERTIAWLLERRAQDPYAPFVPRVLYESAANWTRQAPTFPL